MQKKKYSMFKKMRGKILYFSKNKFSIFFVHPVFVFHSVFCFVQAGRAGEGMLPWMASTFLANMPPWLVFFKKKKVHGDGLPAGRGTRAAAPPFAPRPGAPYACGRGRVPAHQGTRPGVPARLTTPAA
jgi:hypothetical protein